MDLRVYRVVRSKPNITSWSTIIKRISTIWCNTINWRDVQWYNVKYNEDFSAQHNILTGTIGTVSTHKKTWRTRRNTLFINNPETLLCILKLIDTGTSVETDLIPHLTVDTVMFMYGLNNFKWHDKTELNHTYTSRLYN